MRPSHVRGELLTPEQVRSVYASPGDEGATEVGGRPLAISTLAAYCGPAFGAGFMFLLIPLYLMKFATDVLLISPAVMGLIFGLSRLWDAIADPVAGYLSDRTRSRLGR